MDICRANWTPNTSVLLFFLWLNLKHIPTFSPQTFTIQGKIDAAKVSPLVIGSDQKYQIGRTRFKVGGLFSDDDITAFLTKGETPPKTN